MDDCCESKTDELAELRQRQWRVLIVVLAINAAMFCVEFAAGMLAGSTALLGDSLDMLGDAGVYGFTLFVLDRSAAWRARSALAKGVVMAAFGAGVLVQVAVKLARGLTPTAEVMGAVGLAALAANALCLLLLWRHRGDDINMRSAWTCSRNDVIGNVGVLVAALAVGLSGSPWPDIAVGLAVAAVFVRSAAQVVREASRAIAASR
jgi:Co/Zn/Cd efflux system component